MVRKCKLCHKNYFTLRGIAICPKCFMKEFPKLLNSRKDKKGGEE
jgi:hypothetical protein